MHLQLRSIAFAISLAILCRGCAARLTVNNSSSSEVEFQTAQYFWEGDDGSYFEEVTGLLTHVSLPDLQGKIVYLPKMPVKDWLAQIIDIEEAGAIAILYGTNAFVPGQSGCSLAGAVPFGEISIPIVEINNKKFAEIVKAVLNGTTIEVTLTSEGNEWNNILGGITVIIVFRALFTATAAGLIGFALYKLTFFIRVQHSQFNVPQVCLSLEIIANLARIAYFAVDPFSCFGHFGNSLSFMTTLGFSFEVATFVLITFYWHEAVTNASLEVYPFLARFKPFFFVFSILFIAVVILVSVLGFALGFDITTPVIVIYVIVSLAFLIFYSVTVSKIVKKYAKSNSIRQKKTKAINNINKKIIVNGVIRVLSLIPLIIFIDGGVSSVPVPHFVGSVFIYAMVMLDSWARIYLFKVPKKNLSTGIASTTSREISNKLNDTNIETSNVV